ncbi:hypothetical protein Pogu_1002 [Pyrobaculum oguniense TE7]|uniref:Uncharacterized protein n=1 Tax=Pyrobaculum oguniense (strain DSM 13380 / JCM 10595 / TE7) TaxID=698757 RepID=H6Q9X1_PYROT|nr:hypothetical protein Pogu_1002 [Pyrobaculum oguniense TE7]
MLALLGVAAHFQTLMSVEKLAALANISLVPGVLAYTIWNLAMAKGGPTRRLPSPSCQYTP